jgi:hypothetical protein
MMLRESHGNLSGSSTQGTSGFFGGVETHNAIAAASATFDTSTGMLAFLDASKDNIGNMDFAGMPAG